MHSDLYVVMGVSGSGKSSVGVALARALAVAFVEGDEYHPSSNVTRMAEGIALTDDDRRDWLHALANVLGEASRAGTGLVMTCSALKKSYRDILRAEAPALRLVYLEGSRDLIAARLADRRGHFMPPSLLDSQFATLEEPSPDEGAWVCDISRPPEIIVAHLVAHVSG